MGHQSITGHHTPIHPKEQFILDKLARFWGGGRKLEEILVHMGRNSTQTVTQALNRTGALQL